MDTKQSLPRAVSTTKNETGKGTKVGGTFLGELGKPKPAADPRSYLLPAYTAAFKAGVWNSEGKVPSVSTHLNTRNPTLGNSVPEIPLPSPPPFLRDGENLTW